MLMAPQHAKPILATRLTIVVFFSAFCLFSFSSLAELRRFNQPLNAHGGLNFLVVGDWGRHGQYNQSEVALQMGKIGEELDIDFVISTGDNFYDNGLSGVDDPEFFGSFTNIYNASSLQKPWYTVLGNHDYRGNVEAQLDPILREKDPRWHCLRSFVINASIVEFFMVDTTPFVDKYFSELGDHIFDWRGVLPRNQYLSNLLKDLSEELRKSTANWKVVVGHHTILSAGHQGITQELYTQLLPILKENNVDMYINGHDHCLQHIISTESKIQFLTSGGGSKAWRGDIREWKEEELKFYYDGQGFVSIQFTQKSVHFVYYDVYGNVLHKGSISKD